MTSDQAVTLDRARPEDADEIADLYLASRADALPYLRKVHSDEETRTWIREVRLTRGETWVARWEGRIAGFMSLDGDDLDQLYLRPDCYRRGIGSQLLRLAMARSPDGLHLYAFQRNQRARAFYEAHGFVVFDTNDGARNEEGEPDMRLEWRGALSRLRPGSTEGP